MPCKGAHAQDMHAPKQLRFSTLKGLLSVHTAVGILDGDPALVQLGLLASELARTLQRQARGQAFLVIGPERQPAPRAPVVEVLVIEGSPVAHDPRDQAPGPARPAVR